MDPFRNRLQHKVALLIMGGAIFLFSCAETQGEAVEDGAELMTQQSENLTIVVSRDGQRSYRFTTPLLERYEMARQPYMEFRKGVDIETYNDTTQLIESTLTANYAIFLEKQELWEAKGNVIAVNAQGQQLETEQLFWDQKGKRIYSNVDSKVTQGEDVIIGVGFESDEKMEDFTFRKPRGKVNVDLTPSDTTATSAADSSATSTTSPKKPRKQPAVDKTQKSDPPRIREGSPVAKPSTKQLPHPKRELLTY